MSQTPGKSEDPLSKNFPPTPKGYGVTRRRIRLERMAKMDDTEKNKWYDKTGIVLLLVLCFFPIGLYGLWKTQVLSKQRKITIVCIWVGLILFEIFL
jgi:hypothetical protein